MEAAKIQELGDPLRQGFLADLVLDVLATEKSLTPEDREVLSTLKEFLDQSKAGSEQVRTGNLTENALATISAYRATMMSLPERPINGKMRDYFDSFVDSVKAEIDRILESGRVSPNKVATLRIYSRALRKSATNRIGMSVGREVEVLVWPPTTAR